MTPTCFLDTNILISAVEAKPRDERETAVARRLVADEVFGVSAQTIAEFVNVASKARFGLPGDQIDAWIDHLTAMPFTPLDAALIRRGLWLKRRYLIAYYDAALLAAAERLRCPVFYSADLNHGQDYGDVRVVNPFLD